MARKKRLLEDDSDSGESDVGDLDFENDPDAREERALFENPYQNKRRRKNGKEDALYGVFAEDSDDERRGGGRKGASSTVKRSDWAKAPAFVSGEKVDLDKELEVEMETVVDHDEEKGDGDAGSSDDGEDDGLEDDGEDGAEYSDDSEHSRPPSPRVREEEDDEPLERPRMGGLGLGSQKPSASDDVSGGFGSSQGGIGSARNTEFSQGGIGSSSKGGIGSSTAKGGIGSRPSVPSVTDDTPSNSSAFVRDAKPSFKAPVPLNPNERLHFSKIQNTFGARLLAKMGWEAGTGLGATGEGIVTPVESKLRPQKMGMGFNGFKEKTKQSIMEAKRRGEYVSDDEDDKLKKMGKKAREENKKRSDVWKRPKKVKTKTEHKTFEQIIAEAGHEHPAASGIGQIIDATGAVPREVSSLADVSLNSWSPSNDLTRIPEVRHNIRLIADACKSDLDGLAREAKALDERKKLVIQEDLRLRKQVEDEAELIARLQQVQIVANEINAKAKELASVYEVSLEPFSPLIYKLTDQFSREFDRYQLDDVVVAAISPLVRRMVGSWNPLEDPSAFVSTFRSWRRALKVNSVEQKPQTQVDVYGSSTLVAPVDVTKPMTPFESLLWNVWLPKVRTFINNDWSPRTPDPAVKLYETWSTFLPPFIRDNLLDQLILPKIQKAVAEWNPKRESVSLQTIVFPWLPHVGLRLEDLVDEARRKFKSLLRSWAVGDALPADMIPWRDLFDTKDWDAMLLKYVVPKLGATLRNDFRINPRDQKMESIQHVLEWSDIIRSSIFSQLLETEFFPKWLDVLHVWLIQPKVSFEEVAQWYSFWKGSFPDQVQNMPGVARGFTRGLQLMNTAIELGPDAPARLPRPDFRADQSASTTPVRNGTPKLSARPSVRTQEITFRSIVEDFAASHNLLFIPTGRAQEQSRMPLFRVSSTADGKGGLLVYILDDAVWAPADNGGEAYRAISLEDMVLRASM